MPFGNRACASLRARARTLRHVKKEKNMAAASVRFHERSFTREEEGGRGKEGNGASTKLILKLLSLSVSLPPPLLPSLRSS